LRFLNPGHEGVAFLAKTIYLPSSRVAPPETSPAEFIVRPRLQPLRIAPGTTLIAVARIETLPIQAPVSRTPGISSETGERIASEIAAPKYSLGKRYSNRFRRRLFSTRFLFNTAPDRPPQNTACDSALDHRARYLVHWRSLA
jgi:hypothetical protein